MPEEINTIEVPVVEEQKNNQEVVNEVEGLSPEEVEIAKKHGLLPEKEVVEEAEVVKESEENKEEPEEERINKDPDSFEEIDKVFNKDEKKFHEIYTPNQKALYFKSKADRRKRQEAIKELEAVKAQLEEAKKHSASAKKIEKIADLLANKTDELTVEMLQSIINEKEVVEEPKVDVEAQKQQLSAKIQQKNMYAEQIGLAKYDNFIEMAKLASELYQQDRPNGVYRLAIDNAYSDDVDEAELVDTIVRVAKFHPKFDELSKTKAKNSEVKDKIDRVIKNSKKKISSAAVSGGGTRAISEDDITLEQAVALLEKNPSAYHALSQKTKERLLRESGE